MVDNLLGAPVGDLIRELRHRRGLTQTALADRLADVSGNDGVDRRQVARWERGKRIPSRYWRNWIAAVLETPAANLDRAAALAQFLRAAPEVTKDFARAWPLPQLGRGPRENTATKSQKRLADDVEPPDGVVPGITRKRLGSS
jgi:transcriptional regulator with XRE-family HTH domain